MLRKLRLGPLGWLCLASGMGTLISSAILIARNPSWSFAAVQSIQVLIALLLIRMALVEHRENSES